MTSRRGASTSSLPTTSTMRSATSGSQATSQATLSGPCSTCTIRSMAAYSSGADPSTTTTTSLGPAKLDGTPTEPATSRLATDTYTFPGPTITSTGRTDSVP